MITIAPAGKLAGKARQRWTEENASMGLAATETAAGWDGMPTATA
jgi:hypothetical protein